MAGTPTTALLLLLLLFVMLLFGLHVLSC